MKLQIIPNGERERGEGGEASIRAAVNRGWEKVWIFEIDEIINRNLGVVLSNLHVTLAYRKKI